MARIVVAGFLVRNPLGGYAWQAAHYLLGLRALGHDVWFYEDTGHYALAYDPARNAFEPVYDFGLRATEAFLGRLGLGDRWVFCDVGQAREHGPGAGRAATMLAEADLLINVAGINRIPPERRGGRPAAFIDIDPGYTQIKAAQGDTLLRAILDEHRWHFTVGENIGTTRSPLPTAGYRWHPTRPLVALEQWAPLEAPATDYTTVATWNSADRDLVFEGVTYAWRKRSEWLRFLDLPRRSGLRFELAANVDSVPGDVERLGGEGWRIADPRAISGDPWRYRDYLRSSRGEFTVAKDLNVRLRSGWFSDRAACYLAAARPAIEQDTGFGDVLPLGPGLHAFRTPDDALAALAAVEADYPRARRHALEVAREHLAAERVLAALLRTIGV